MINGRRRIVQLIMTGAALATVLAIARHFAASQLIFRNRDVFWYITEDYKNGRLPGDREVEGVFDYRGPRVSAPSSGPIREWLRLYDLWPVWRPPEMSFGEIVLSDENNHELARMPGDGTDQRVYPSLRTQENDTELYVSWYFDLPPQVDRRKPLKFSTTFSINGFAPLPVSVTIPPIARPTTAPSR